DQQSGIGSSFFCVLRVKYRICCGFGGGTDDKRNSARHLFHGGFCHLKTFFSRQTDKFSRTSVYYNSRYSFIDKMVDIHPEAVQIDRAVLLHRGDKYWENTLYFFHWFFLLKKFCMMAHI